MLKISGTEEVEYQECIEKKCVPIVSIGLKDMKQTDLQKEEEISKPDDLAIEVGQRIIDLKNYVDIQGDYFKRMERTNKLKKIDEVRKRKQTELLSLIKDKLPTGNVIIKGGFATFLHTNKYLTDDIDMVYKTDDLDEERKSLYKIFNKNLEGVYTINVNTSERNEKGKPEDKNINPAFKPFKVLFDNRPILEISFENLEFNDTRVDLEGATGINVLTIDSLLRTLLKASKNFEKRVIARKINQSKESIYDGKLLGWMKQLQELLRKRNPMYYEEISKEMSKGKKGGGRKKRTRKRIKKKYKKRRTKKKKKRTKKKRRKRRKKTRRRK